MTKFSIRDIAFSGYRLLAAKPGAAVVWFVFSLLVLLGMTALTVQMAGPQMMALKEMQTSGQRPDPATVMALTTQILPVTLLKIIIPLFTGAVLMAAIIRSVVRPAPKGLGYLRVGADEFRLLLVSLVLVLIWMVPFAIAQAAGMMTLFGVMGAREAGAALQGAGSLPAGAMAAAIAAATPGLALFVWLYVKLSLAGPQTVAERQIRIFNSWTLTRGLFWRALWTYVLAAIPTGIGYLAFMAAATQVRTGGWMHATEADVGSMAVAFSPAQLALYVAQALLQVFYVAALTVPAILIYTAAAGGTMAADEEYEDDED